MYRHVIESSIFFTFLVCTGSQNKGILFIRCNSLLWKLNEDFKHGSEDLLCFMFYGSSLWMSDQWMSWKVRTAKNESIILMLTLRDSQFAHFWCVSWSVTLKNIIDLSVALIADTVRCFNGDLTSIFWVDVNIIIRHRFNLQKRILTSF